jgi:ribosome maturation factor RimP
MNWQVAVENTITQLGYELVECERGGRGLLRITIDRVAGDPSGDCILVEDCEKVTRQLQQVLEVEACAYERLEVSSPGLDRPLKKPADFVRFAGQEIEVIFKLPFQGRKKYKGLLEAQESGSPESGWSLSFHDGKQDQVLAFTFEEIKEARLVPVLDFKGRRFMQPLEMADAGAVQGNATDGDRKQ